MLLDVSRAILSQGEEFSFTHHEEIEPQEIFGETVSFDTALMTGAFRMEGDSLLLRGTLKTVAHGHCAACFAPVDFPAEAEFDEVYHRVSRWEKAAENEQEEDPFEDHPVFEGSRVDLNHLAMSLAVLNLPMRFMCTPICKTMKAIRDRENENDDCQKELPDQHPFSALQQLLTKDEEV